MASFKVGDTVKVRNDYERFWVRIEAVHKGLTDTVYAATVENQLVEDVGYTANDTIYFVEDDVIEVYDESKQEKILIKNQFGEDYDRFVGDNNESKLKSATCTLSKELREMINEGKLYICDKESCAVFEASNVVGWRDGLMILNDR